MSAATLAAVVAAAAAYLAFTVWRDGRALKANLARATGQLERGDWEGAERTFQTMAELSHSASGRTKGPIGTVFANVPVAGRPVRTARAILVAGTAVSELAAQTLPQLRDRTFWQRGRIDIASLRSLRPTVETSVATLERARTDLERSPAWPLVGSLARARQTLRTRLADTERSARTALLVIDLSERVLGAQGERRYFVAFENLAETRGAGGMWGNYGVMVARDGRLGLGRFGRLQEELAAYATTEGPDWYRTRYERFGASHDWRQMPTAPDFPTVAAMAEGNLAAAAGIGPVDGVIAIDAGGLAALLRITGPVMVPSWPEPVDARNVGRITLHDEYSHFETNEQRVRFLSDTAYAVWSRLLTADVDLRALGRSGLGRAIREKHLKLHFAREEEQRLAETMEATGGVGDRAHTIALVTQNVSGHKMDWWLHRKLDLTLRLRRNGGATGEATITLTNEGPAEGEPGYVIGPFDERFKGGWNRQLVRVYLPSSTTVTGGDADPPRIASEQGFVVAEWEVDVPPGDSVTRTVRFDVASAWAPDDGHIALRLRRQPLLHPDDVRIDVVPPRGRRVSVAPEAACSGGRTRTDVFVEGAVGGSIRSWFLGPGSAEPCE